MSPPPPGAVKCHKKDAPKGVFRPPPPPHLAADIALPQETGC